MSVRLLLATLSPCLLSALFGCTDGKDPTGTDDTATSSVGDGYYSPPLPETAESGGPEPGDKEFVPQFLMLDANFGYDRSTSSIIDALTPYGPLPSAIGIYLG